MIISAVIVTYNRLTLLKECVDAYLNQTRIPDYIIIIDNASTDGTKEYLDSIKNDKLIVIHKNENTGGSGGFYTGFEEAMKTDAEWIWVADDDAVPNLDVFEKAEKHLNEMSGKTISAICTQVQTNNTPDLTHRRNISLSNLKVIETPIEASKYNDLYFNCDESSYVGSIINVQTLKKVGITERDFFIWYDDTEHFWRLKKEGAVLCFPDMIVNHKINVNVQDCLSWKTYYGYRNFLFMIKKHLGIWYFISYVFRTLSRGPRKRSLKHSKLGFCAVWDAIRGKKGIHPVYKPGWK